jgi:hypothetical protein
MSHLRTTIPTIDYDYTRSIAKNIDQIRVPEINPIYPADGYGYGNTGYDPVSGWLYYNDAGTWTLLNGVGPTGPTGGTGAIGPIGPTGPTGSTNVYGYCIAKNGDQTIPANTWTQLVSFTGSPPPYATLPQWDLTTGVYTASDQETVTFNADISWKKNVSAQGIRQMRLAYLPLGIPPAIIVKQTNTLPDSFKGIETTQEMSVTAEMNATDQIYIEVFHDAPMSLIVEGGVGTTVSGIRYDTS